MFLFGLIFGVSGIAAGLYAIIKGDAPNPLTLVARRRVNNKDLKGTRGRIAGWFSLPGGIVLFWMGVGEILDHF